MSDFVSTHLRPLSPGVILALIAILFGFGLGGVFGAAEHAIKENLNARAEAVFSSVYAGDAEKKDAVVEKSWAYMKRSHLHAGGIGATALAAITLLSLLGPPGLLERLSSLALGAGSVLYPLFWLWAALKAPGLGSTSAAKDALGFIAVPGAGLCMLGVLGALTAAVKRIAVAPTDA